MTTDTPKLPDKRAQVIAQCNAVARLARSLAEVREQTAMYIPDAILDMVGSGTAYQMEVLGDMLNNMDANDPADDDLDPVFHAAQVMFPQDPYNYGRMSTLTSDLAACRAVVRSLIDLHEGKLRCAAGETDRECLNRVTKETLAAARAILPPVEGETK